MSEDIKLEYQALRDEYAVLTEVITTTVNYSVGGCIAIMSFIFAKNDITFWLFTLPLLIIFPACYILVSRIQSLFRIATYVIVFIEPQSDLKYETRLLKFKCNSKIKFNVAVLLVYLGLIVIDIGVFISKDYSNIYHVITYLATFGVFGHIYYLMTRDWKGIFIDIWRETIRDEKNGS